MVTDSWTLLILILDFDSIQSEETCLMFSDDFGTHIVHMFLHEFVAIGMTLKSGSVWSSVI